MEVILIQDLERIGKINSIIKVKDGFARNFLFPRNLAIAATPANLRRLQQDKQRVANLLLQQKEKALNLSNRLSSMSITIPVKTHNEDNLYGSISAANIIEALNQDGISEIRAESVILDEPIKSTGVYEVKIKLHPEVLTKIKVWVVKK